MSMGSLWYVAEYVPAYEEWFLPGIERAYERTDFDEVGKQVFREVAR